MSRCALHPDVLARNRRGQAGLWPHGVSGDLPIVLIKVLEPDDLTLVRQVLQAQEYWRLKGLRADLVILNEHPAGLSRRDAHSLADLVESGSWNAWRTGPAACTSSDRGRRFPSKTVSCSSRSPEPSLRGNRGELAEQLDRPSPPPWPTPRPLAIAAD